MVVNAGAMATVLAIFMSSQAISREEVDVSCLDSEIHVCVKSLQKAGLSFPVATVDQQLADNSRTDVNGKIVPSDMSVHVTVTYPSSDSTRMLDIHYRSGFVVDSVTIQLQGDPSVAKTTPEYDQTGLFAAVTGILGGRCGFDRPALYRFFENQAKGKMNATYGNSSVPIPDAESYHRYALDLSFCGDIKLDFSSFAGHNVGLISPGNSHGFFSHASLMFHH